MKCHRETKFGLKNMILFFRAVTVNQMGFMTNCFLVSHQIFYMLMIDSFHLTCICMVKLLLCFGLSRHSSCSNCWVWHPVLRWLWCWFSLYFFPCFWWQHPRYQLPVLTGKHDPCQLWPSRDSTFAWSLCGCLRKWYVSKDIHMGKNGGHGDRVGEARVAM